jgi:hypothetical protein
VRRGYHPRRGGRYNSEEDRSPSPEPPGPRVFSQAIRRALFLVRFRAPTTITTYSGETRPELWLADYRLACQLGGTNDDNLIIRNLPFSSPKLPGHGWSICLLRRSPTGTTWSRASRETSKVRTCTLGTHGISEAAASSQGNPCERTSGGFRSSAPSCQHHRLGRHWGIPRRHHVSGPGEQTGAQDSYQGERIDGHRHQVRLWSGAGRSHLLKGQAASGKDKQPQGRQKEDAPEASVQRGSKKKAKRKAQAKRDAVDADLVAAAEHRNPRKPPGGVNTFDKMLKESCPYHRGPVKHTLEKCDMLRRYFIKAGPSAEGGKDQDNNRKGGDKEEEFPEVRDCFMIYGGQATNASARHRKQEHREVCSVKVATPVYLDWSDKPITFDQADHPDYMPSLGRYPLVVDPVIGNARLTKVLMDGGSSLNIISAETLGLLGIDLSMIQAGAAPFHGIVPGKRVLPLGQLDLLVCFITPSNFRRETLTFEVVGFRETYHAVLGRPCYAKFMAVPNYTYLKLKMPGPNGTITVDPRTAMLTSATWNAWSTLRPSPSPRPSSPTWIASSKRRLMRSATPATSNQSRRLRPSPSTPATTPASKSGLAPSSTPNRKQCSSTFSAQMPKFLCGVPRTCQAYRGMSPSTHWISELVPDP